MSRQVGLSAAGIGLVLIIVLATRVQPGGPSVDRGAIAIDSVRRGDIVREVRAQGKLVPERIHWITAQASARVERVMTQSGQTVSANQLLLELANPDVQIQAMRAEQQVREARTALMSLRTNLESQTLAQEALVASTHTQYISAMQEALAADSLQKGGLISKFDVTNKREQAKELTTKLRVEEQRLRLMNQAMSGQISAQAEQVEQLKTIAAHQQQRLLSLQVRAPEAGVLQDLDLQLGQWVAEGTTLAKVVQPGKLKAVLRVVESQAKDIELGQKATIDTRNGIVPGHVSRKDPGAQSGTVTIDVALDAPPPTGAVPDLTVDGTVEIGKLINVLYTGRPTTAASTGLVGLFKLAEDGKSAIRVQVLLGRSSVKSVEIVRGLLPADKVIVSDMSSYDNLDRVRIR